MSTTDPDTRRAELVEGWDRASAGWGRRADEIRHFGMPVAAWLIEHLELQPGQRVLELAAGPGDVGFLASELVKPGGTLITSDASEGMLGVARSRASALGIDNVEFQQLQLEWLDLPTASVDAIVCRWGFMLCLDPAAALGEARRVLRPGGRISIAVWDEPALNPWATIPGRALIELGHTSPPSPDEPGMFALAAPGRLHELIETAGFVEVEVDTVEVERRDAGVDAFLAETFELSQNFASVFGGLGEPERAAVRSRVAELVEPYLAADGGLVLPGRSLVATASA